MGDLKKVRLWQHRLHYDLIINLQKESGKPRLNFDIWFFFISVHYLQRWGHFGEKSHENCQKVDKFYRIPNHILNNNKPNPMLKNSDIVMNHMS